MKKKLISVLLAVSMVLSMTACGNSDPKTVSVGSESEGASSEAESASEPAGETDVDVETNDEAGHYTFAYSTTSLSTWSPTDWLVNNEWEIQTFTSTFLYDFVMNEAKDGYEIVPGLASAMPVDVTADYAGNETYGVPADATEGYAWQVKIIENAAWEDGTPITTGDFDYTIRQFLNPDMKNMRASSLYQGSLGLANALAYYNAGLQSVYDTETGTAADVADEDMLFSLTQPNAYLGDYTVEDYYGYYPDYYLDADGNDIYEQLSEMVGSSTYVPLTEDMKALITALAANFGDEDPDIYKQFCFYRDASTQVTWDQVGFVADDDYTMTFVLASPCTEFQFEYASGFALVNEELYEANKKETGDIVKSSYGTAKEKYMSYGPYKIESYQEGKEMKLTKNENWFGYSDDKYEGEYTTTDILAYFIDEHTTEMSLFLQGNLDKVTLSSDDIANYGSSDYVYYLPESYTYMYTFNSDIDKLKAEESEGENHSILSYEDFRHAISLAMDRNDYVKSCTAASEPGYGFINYVYICDPDTGEVYRESDHAKAALCEAYGATDESEITGYDQDAARALFQSAYEACLTDGNIAESDQVVLDYHVNGSGANDVKIVDYLQQAINAATTGTDLDGKVTVKLVEDPDYYDNLMSGIVDIALTAWGGEELNPYGIMECYCDDAYKGEYGFDPYTEEWTINVNGEEITKTFYDWESALNYGEYKNADSETRNQILAGIETGLILQYEAVPLYYSTTGSLYSHRTVLGSEEYINVVVGYGEDVRYLTYTMDDAEWTEYCAENNKQLTY